MLWTSFLVCIFVTIHTVIADDCQFPIGIPAILSIDQHGEATSSGEELDYGCTVTFSDEYPIVDVVWLYWGTFESDKTKYLPVWVTEKGFGPWKTITKSPGRHQLSLHVEEMVHEVSLFVTFDIGCTQLKENLMVIINNNKSFTAFPPGKLIHMPQPEIIYEPGKPVEIGLAIETGDAAGINYSVNFNPLIYRNDSGAIKQYLGVDHDPIVIETVPSHDPPNGQLQKWTGTVTISKGVKDVTAYASFALNGFSDTLDRFSASYYVTFHTDEEMAPVYDVWQCIDNYKEIVRSDGNGGVLLQQPAGLPACLYIVADGNPLPEVALAEVRNGSHGVTKLTPFSTIRFGVTVSYIWYYMDVLQEGEIRDYILQFGDLTQKIRIEAILPTPVDDPDNTVHK